MTGARMRMRLTGERILVRMLSGAGWRLYLEVWEAWL